MRTRDPMIWLAQRLRDACVRDSAATSLLRRDVHEWLDHQRNVEHLWRRFEKAEQRGWRLASTLLKRQLLQAVCGSDYFLERVREHEVPPVVTQSRMREVLAELRQLREEFGEIVIDTKRGVVAVITDPVVLKGIDLGRFRIELHTERLRQHCSAGAFKCVALDPNPPTSSEEVTHPHVKDDALCAGEAAVSIARALSDGRLCDAMMLVRSVLNTYNAASPYVALSDWDGVACPDCGHSCNRDDLYYCPHCEQDFCESCISCCNACDDAYCQTCLERERWGGRWLCPNCRDTCAGCGCVTAAGDAGDDGLCVDCRAKQEQDSAALQPLQPTAQLITQEDSNDSSDPVSGTTSAM